MTNPNWFAKTESRLYAYPALIARHRAAIVEYHLLTPAPRAKSFNGASFIRGGPVSGEAERWVLAREKIAQGVLFLEKRVSEELHQISALWEILREEEKTLVAAKYFEQKPPYAVCETLSRSRQSCNKIRARAVKKAAYIFGLIDEEEYMKVFKA
jgi:hypothetical protein